MATTIIAAATNADLDTESYFDLAARAATSCLDQSGITADQVGMLINAGVFRDHNISEPAVSALIQKRVGIGLEYRPGRVPAFSFDLMNGATGLLHAISTADCFLATGEMEYALLVAGDTHPSMARHVDGFPYSASAAALLLGRSGATGGFGVLHSTDTTAPTEPTAWVALGEAGTNGRNAMRTRAGNEDPVELSAIAVRRCIIGEGLDVDDFTEGRAVLLAPTWTPAFRAHLADALGLTPESIIGVDPSVDHPYSAAPVHAYLSAHGTGRLATARSVLFLAADETSAACLAYHPRALVAVPERG
jgi:3-oxoacyl-[acyl-carrier-protein] synthase-3